MDILTVEMMMSGHFMCRKCGTSNENNAWKILDGYLKAAREKIIFFMVDGNKTRVGRESASDRISKLDGFMSACSVGESIVNQARFIREAEKIVEEVQSDGTDAGSESDGEY